MELLTDKEIHCITRHIQSDYAEEKEYSPCWYCKYAIECADDKMAKKGRASYFYFDKALPALGAITGISIEPRELRFHKYLKGSWLEDYPELMDVATRLSAEELSDIFHNPGILDYAHNPTTDKMQMLLKNQEAGI